MTENTSSFPSYSNGISFVPQTLTTSMHSLVRQRYSVPITPSPPQPLHNCPPQSPPIIMNHRHHNGLQGQPAIDDDEDISLLQCGSINPDPKYDQALDPLRVNATFFPPTEITVRIKQPIPEWLRLDRPRPILDRRRSAPMTFCSPPRTILKREASCTSRLPSSSSPEKSTTILVNGSRPGTLTPRRRRHSLLYLLSECNISVGQSSLRTSPTEESFSDGESQVNWLKVVVPERRSLVRRKWKHLMSKIRIIPFQRNDSIALQRSVRGCFT